MSFGPKYDRKWINDDGSTFYGQDDGKGSTTWFDSDGNPDSISDTPSRFEQEVNAWEHGEDQWRRRLVNTQ